jgi:hypothetical protein
MASLMNTVRAVLISAAIWVVSFVLAYLVFGLALGYFWSVNISDGQSGLGPFLNILYSALTASISAIISLILVLRRLTEGKRAA